MKTTFYITTPIYYVNAKPHIGHAYTSIAADTAARYQRLLGQEVIFLTGTDEHGQKILQEAQKQGISPQEFVDAISEKFKDLWDEMGIEYDHFIRTTEKRHKDSVCKVLNKLYEAGDLYKGEYKGSYCTPCETFWTDSQITDEKICPDCARKLDEITEENYFFKISKYQKWLLEYIEEHEDFIQPVTRRNEIVSFLQQPLEDLCVSRPKTRLSWGISLPFSEDHVTYVWFDALINYISAVDYLNESETFQKFWPADFHLIGKDIIRHHAVFWPIMLKALGLEMPKCIFAHGWWMQGGAKISKSKGKVIDPAAIIDDFGIDALRYFLLREVPFGQDGTYSDEAFVTRYNSDLANDIGNLSSRTLTMVEKYFEGKVPEQGTQDDSDNYLLEKFNVLVDEITKSMEKLEFHTALIAVWEFINRANKYIEDSKPWTLSKEGNIDRLKTVIYNLTEALRVISILVWPFMPTTAQSIWQQLGLKGTPKDGGIEPAKKWALLEPGTPINKQPPLFPRRK